MNLGTNLRHLCKYIYIYIIDYMGGDWVHLQSLVLNVDLGKMEFVSESKDDLTFNYHVDNCFPIFHSPFTVGKESFFLVQLRLSRVCWGPV